MLTSVMFITMVALFIVCIFLGLYLYRNTKELVRLKKQLSLVESELSSELKRQKALQTELEESKTKLSDTILLDPLTALPSRQIFEDRLGLTLNQSARYQMIFAVLFLDVDGFKIINDALGHDVGDKLLKEIAMRLQDSVRQVDTVSRFAGDEFVFLLPQLAKAETAAYIAQRFLDAISQPFKVSDQELYITGSIGIAVYPSDGADMNTLLKHADNALHQAKSRGRNTYQFYREEMHVVSRREFVLSSSLRSEQIYREFLLYYQPRMNIETKKIVCMEAMLRWQHPDFGFLGWDDFVRLADNSGKIGEIGEWVLLNACQNLFEWRKQNFFPDTISVQATLKQLEGSHFIQKISNILQGTKIDPESIIFEITESSLIARVDVIEKILHMLKHLGVRISINHFGTGLLSFQHLRRFPIDSVKIDSSLVHDAATTKEGLAIVKAIVALAKNLQLEVTVDGVESVKQKLMLQDLGCQIMQGALFGGAALAHAYNQDMVQHITENASLGSS